MTTDIKLAQQDLPSPHCTRGHAQATICPLNDTAQTKGKKMNENAV